MKADIPLFNNCTKGIFAARLLICALSLIVLSVCLCYFFLSLDAEYLQSKLTEGVRMSTAQRKDGGEALAQEIVTELAIWEN